TLGCKKKLSACRPKGLPQQIQTQRPRRKKRTEPSDPASLERAVRQLLADKISGNQVGIWLLAPEHLRLGTWDLLCAWSPSDGPTIWPRMALHLVHEAAFCVNGLRNQRSLTQKGFELSNVLPFVPTDYAIHGSVKSGAPAATSKADCWALILIALKAPPNARCVGTVSAPTKRRLKWRSVSS